MGRTSWTPQIAQSGEREREHLNECTVAVEHVGNGEERSGAGPKTSGVLGNVRLNLALVLGGG